MLEGLTEITLPNNLMAAGLAPDLTPAYTDPTAATDATNSGAADSASPLSVPATAAPVDPVLFGQWASQIPDSTVIALAGNAPGQAGPLTPSDILFQSMLGGPVREPLWQRIRRSPAGRGRPAAVRRPTSSAFHRGLRLQRQFGQWAKRGERRQRTKW